MPKYQVNLLRVNSLSPVVEADNEEEAIDLAFKVADKSFICAKCTGWGKDWYIDPGEWELFTEVNGGSDIIQDVELVE